MKLSATHLKRYKEIAGLLWKYGRSDLAGQMNSSREFGPADIPEATSTDAKPEQLADDLEAMGPTYVKLGPGPRRPAGFVARRLPQGAHAPAE